MCNTINIYDNVDIIKYIISERENRIIIIYFL